MNILNKTTIIFFLVFASKSVVYASTIFTGTFNDSDTYNTRPYPDTATGQSLVGSWNTSTSVRQYFQIPFTPSADGNFEIAITSATNASSGVIYDFDTILFLYGVGGV